MTVAQGLAALTLSAGILLLLAWAYATTGIARSNALLVKSLWLFLLPIAALLFLPEAMFTFPLSMWAWVAGEEALKSVAAKTEPGPMERFWLITLFGLWELILAKPLWWLAMGGEVSDWTRVQLAGLVGATALTVAMHTVTAAVYAFHFRDRLWAAFLLSWTVHILYNESIVLFGVSLLSTAMRALLLATMLGLLWPQPPPSGSAQEDAR